MPVDGDARAVLDATGTILRISDAWAQALDGHGVAGGPGVGDSYLSIREHLRGGPDAANRVRAACAGAHPLAVPIGRLDASPPGAAAVVLVSSRYDGSGRCVGATVSLALEAPGARPGPPSGMVEPKLPEVGEAVPGRGHLRALLAANAMFVGELDVGVVLRDIVRAARELVGARYAALGVTAADGSLEEFVHDGMDEDTVARIGRLPVGLGILGLMTGQAEPVRLRELGLHQAAAVGFPADHPAMRSFLGVPIRVRDKLLGNLYLTESRAGEFTAEDEQLALALAATAGVAIENARLHQDSEGRRRWQAISTEATRMLLSGDGADHVEGFLRLAQDGADATFALLARSEDDQVVIGSLAGEFDPAANSTWTSWPGSVEPVLSSGTSVLVRGGTDPSAPQRQPAGSLIAAPLHDGEHVVAAIVLGRDRGAPFEEAELEQLAGFAGHIEVALRLDRVRVDREVVTMLRERDRIADDLHNHAIKELFATGMGILGVAQHLDSPDDRTRLTGYVDALDETVHRMRSSVFQRAGTGERDRTLRQRVMAVLDQEGAALGLTAHVGFAGSPDDEIAADLADGIVAALRETLSFAARETGASNVEVLLDVSAERVILEVVGDGHSGGPLEQSSGLAMVRKRAARHHGSLELITLPGGRNHFRWTAQSRRAGDRRTGERGSGGHEAPLVWPLGLPLVTPDTGSTARG